MYEERFGLDSNPFAFAPQVDRYVALTAFEEAREALRRCLERGQGVGLLVASAGCGKTMLCLRLAADLGETFRAVVLPGGRLASPTSLFQSLLHELHQPATGLGEGELRLALMDVASVEFDERPIALFVDEAQSLPYSVLDELRLVGNLAAGGAPRVRMVFSGASRLEERFAAPRLESLAQRVAVRASLAPLGREDVRRYLSDRLAASGGELATLFDESAVSAVRATTDGIPRLINQLGEHALLEVCEGGSTPLDEHAVEFAWASLQQLPLPAGRAAAADPAEPPPSDVIEFGELDEEADASPEELAAQSTAAETPSDSDSESESWPAFGDVDGDVDGEIETGVEFSAGADDEADSNGDEAYAVAPSDFEELAFEAALDEKPEEASDQVDDGRDAAAPSDLVEIVEAEPAPAESAESPLAADSAVTWEERLELDASILEEAVESELVADAAPAFEIEIIEEADLIAESPVESSSDAPLQEQVFEESPQIAEPAALDAQAEICETTPEAIEEVESIPPARAVNPFADSFEDEEQVALRCARLQRASAAAPGAFDGLVPGPVEALPDATAGEEQKPPALEFLETISFPSRDADQAEEASELPSFGEAAESPPLPVPVAAWDDGDADDLSLDYAPTLIFDEPEDRLPAADEEASPPAGESSDAPIDSLTWDDVDFAAEFTIETDSSAQWMEESIVDGGASATGVEMSDTSLKSDPAASLERYEDLFSRLRGDHA